jgi:homocitrate synthase NifV
MPIPHPVWLIDSTLRDGEQAPGVAFRPDEKILLARMLDDIGIDEIEAGTPAMGSEECDVVRKISRLGLHARISVWCRALRTDIDLAAETGAERIHMAFPVSDIQLAAINKNRQWVDDTLPQLVAYAARRFAYVSVGAQDAGRCETKRLLQFVEAAVRCNVDRIRIADTVGLLTPTKTTELIATLRKQYPVPDIDFHGHDDLGMATANAVTAWQSGATSLSVTVNGLGERAGNAALEEVLMALSLIYGETRYATATLHALCCYVAAISGRPIPVGKAISGESVLSHESGIHARGTLQNVTAFQAFDGTVIGRESFRNLFGKHSGKGAVIELLKSHGLPVDDHRVASLLKTIRETAAQNKRAMSATEVVLLEKLGEN